MSHCLQAAALCASDLSGTGCDHVDCLLQSFLILSGQLSLIDAEWQIAAASGDVNENAVQFITDWVISNKAYFGEKAIGTCLGTMSESGNVAYIFPSTLNQALTKAGYSPRKTLKYMADNGLIATASEGSDSKQRYSVKRRFDGRSCRFVEFKIGQFSEKDDDIESEADKYEQESFMDSDGFMSIPEGMEEELPFK